MESNFEKESSGSTTTLSPDQASYALSAVAADQASTRAAAVPPKWYVLLVSIYTGVMFAQYAIPDSVWLVGKLLAIILIVALLAAMVWFVKHRPVDPGRFALFHSVRGAIPIIVLITAIVALTCVEPLSIPWWGHLCIGACLGVATYYIARWAWRRWAEAPAK